MRMATVLLTIALAACGGGGGEPPVAASPVPLPDPIDAPAGCEAAVRMPIEGTKHLAPNTSVTYKTNPPTSGPHFSAPIGPLAPGVYNEIPVDGALVHNLEHGHVILWHAPGISKAQLDALTDVLRGGPRFRLLVPRASMPYKVAFTAWGVIQGCAAPTAEIGKAAARFAQRFQQKAPENIPGRPLA